MCSLLGRMTQPDMPVKASHRQQLWFIDDHQWDFVKVGGLHSMVVWGKGRYRWLI
jgi:hypothetical protein